MSERIEVQRPIRADAADIFDVVAATGEPAVRSRLGILDRTLTRETRGASS
ncbi:MAG: hypothetical protein QNM02_08150 [Acidimicrobiia bacterium]|nr:hypothetical protein [Acidimicrobiia bacterium]